MSDLASQAKAVKIRAAQAISREREARVFELRKTGATFAAIGAELAMTESGAHRAYRRALRRYPAQEGVEEARALEAIRLDAMQVGVWPRAVSGDEKAIDRVLAIMKRRAEMLGLDHAAELKVHLFIRQVYAELRAMPEADLLDLLGYGLPSEREG